MRAARWPRTRSSDASAQTNGGKSTSSTCPIIWDSSCRSRRLQQVPCPVDTPLAVSIEPRPPAPLLAGDPLRVAHVVLKQVVHLLAEGFGSDQRRQLQVVFDAAIVQ